MCDSCLTAEGRLRSDCHCQCRAMWLSHEKTQYYGVNAQYETDIECNECSHMVAIYRYEKISLFKMGEAVRDANIKP